MRRKIATTVLPEMLEVLKHNGIDTDRVIDASLRHVPEGAVTEITVTMLALDPEDDQR